MHHLVQEPDFDQALLDQAREFVNGQVQYKFTAREKLALMPFFTNGNKRVFFIHNLPTSIASALLAMYSRLKNVRGMRGHFVDNLLPMLLASNLRRFRNLNAAEEDLKKIACFIKSKGLSTLDKFCDYDEEHEILFAEFLTNVRLNSGYLVKLANSPKISVFLGMWLDAYGHNSIARPANLVFGVEDVSILAAKSFEWGRPGAGYIELSTRYVDFSRRSQYPIEKELLLFDKDLARKAELVIEKSVSAYQQMVGADFDGPLPDFFRKHFSQLVPPKDIGSAVMGETCDVAGNLLPCSTLTSLGISVSGEAFPELIKHLYLDATYENRALAELILFECAKVGGEHFARHLEVSDWREYGWRYLSYSTFAEDDYCSRNNEVEARLLRVFNGQTDNPYGSFSEVLEELRSIKRDSHDKLPNQFEFINAGFARKISFRSWRDLQRQGFCAHLRTLVTPKMGFYRYDKPAPKELAEVFTSIGVLNNEIWDLMSSRMPPVLTQYPMAMGNLVGCQISGNLLQWEFLNWQRTKFSVNHEVRQIVLSIENTLRKHYPWWSKLSRADITPAYVCARSGEGLKITE